MSTNQVPEYREKIDELNKYFANAKDDPLLLKRMREDPLGVLQSMDIPVEDQFKEAVTLQLRAVADLTSLQTRGSEEKLMLASDMPPEVQQALEFWVKPWGLVLVVREPAVKYLQGGGRIGSGVLSIIAAAAGVTGPLGVGIALILGVYASILGIYLGVITLIDQGKGVYITETWPQIVLFSTPFGLPVVGPIT